MARPRGSRRWLTLPWRSERTIARDVHTELEFHVAERAREFVAAGLDPAEAEQRARAELRRLMAAEQGLVADEVTHTRAVRRWDAREDFVADLAFAFRQLVRHRTYAATALVTLALGTGALTAIFSVVNAVVVRSLPFPEPDRIVALSSDRTGRASAVAPRDFLDWQSGARTLAHIAAFYAGTANLTGRGEPLRLQGARVTEEFFRVLRVEPIAGRSFAAGEDRAGAARVAILSDRLWRRQFNADARVVGTSIVLDGHPTEIIGIVPDGAAQSGAQYWSDGVDLWLPLRFDSSDASESSRGARWLRVIGRLGDGATLEQARVEMSTIARRLEAVNPRTNAGVGVRTDRLQDAVVGSIRRPLLVILGAVAFVLLVACTNVANLTLARVAARRSELAVRAALGAGRGRISRQLVTECLVLGMVGGVLGFLLASYGVRVLVALAPDDIPRLGEVRASGGIFLFSLGLSVATGVLVGLVPALHVSLEDLTSELRDGLRGSTVGRGGQRLRRALVVAQTALAVILMASAGLLVRSFLLVREVDPGFEPARVSTFTVTLPLANYPTTTQQHEFAVRVDEQLRAIRGVESVAAAFGLPLTGTRFSLSFTIEGVPEPPPNREPTAQIRIVTEEYFRTMGIPLVQGRLFTADDRRGAPRAILVSQETAQRFFPGESPLGKRIQTGWRDGDQRLGGEIVGIVGDVRQFGLDSAAVPLVYAAEPQWPFDEYTFVVRSSLSPAALMPAMRVAVANVDPTLPVFDMRTLTAIVDDSLAPRRFYLTLLLLFAGVGATLASVGIYGVVAYGVEQRVRELGIRLALGAPRFRVIRMVIGEGVSLAAVGAALGTVGALFLTGLLRSLLFGVDPADGPTFVTVAVMLLVVAVAASVLPAHRAARVDPGVVMK